MTNIKARGFDNAEPLREHLAELDDEHRPIERRRAAGPLDRVKEGQALADEGFRTVHDSRSKIWPTVGGKSHHLARIFKRLDQAKERKLGKMTLSGKVARPLLSGRQV